MYELICRRGLAFQIFKVRATLFRDKKLLLWICTFHLRDTIRSRRGHLLRDASSNVKVKFRVTFSRLRINYYIRELVCSIKIYFDGNQPRSIQFFHIFFVYYSSEWFESTKEQDIFNFARCSIFFHIRRSIRFVLIKMQNNGIQTDQLVINNLSIIINLLSFPFSNDWFYRTIWMEREKERNTK